MLLSLYEKQVSSEIDQLEQLATVLQSTGRIPGKGPDFLKRIGTLLLVEQRMVGRAEITEKPEILWDNPGLEGLFLVRVGLSLASRLSEAHLNFR